MNIQIKNMKKDLDNSLKRNDEIFEMYNQVGLKSEFLSINNLIFLQKKLKENQEIVKRLEDEKDLILKEKVSFT